MWIMFWMKLRDFLVGGRSKFVVGEGIRWVKELYKIILWFLFQFQDIPAGQCML